MDAWELLATLLILSPIQTPLPPLPEAANVGLHRAAHRLDIKGDDEPWINDYASELTWCREVYRELADCPHSWDADRWPPWETTWEVLQFHDKWRAGLDAWYVASPAHRRDILLVEEIAKRHRRAWDLAYQSQGSGGTYGYVRRQRLALKELRELLGEEEYYAGWLPAPVPLWAFQRAE